AAQAGGRGTDAEFQRGGHFFAVVQAEKDAGGQRVAGAGGADDFAGGKLDAALGDEGAVASEGADAFRKMGDDPLVDAGAEEGLHCLFQRKKIEAVFGLDFEAGGALELEFVEEAVVHKAEGGADDVHETLAVLADDVDAGGESGLFGAAQDAGGNAAVALVGLVELVKKKQIAQVKNPVPAGGEIEMAVIEKGVGA